MHDMARLSSLRQQGAGLPGTLAASFDAFEAIRHLARQCQDQEPDLFAAFMTTASAAADGRDAITTAPALPPPDPATPQDNQPAPPTDPGTAADAIAALAALLARRLDHTTTLTSTTGDRIACQDAADAASQIHQLMIRGDHHDSPLR